MRLLIVFLYFAFASCDNYSIRGSWYTDLKNGDGAYDSVTNYAEIYVNDTTLYFQEELMGQTGNQAYFIRGDSIYKCFHTGSDCSYIPMYHIEKLMDDTIWLSVNAKYAQRNPRTYWVRLPQGEYGHYDLKWTRANNDSLKNKVVYDYQRRLAHFYAIKSDQLEKYDSLLRMGYWDWNMDSIRSWDSYRTPKGLQIDTTSKTVTEFTDILIDMVDTTKAN